VDGGAVVAAPRNQIRRGLNEHDFERCHASDGCRVRCDPRTNDQNAQDAARALSLQRLAELSDVSVGMLSHIERGLTSPSLRTLNKIRLALDVPISALFEAADEPEGVDFVRRAKSRPVRRLTCGCARPAPVGHPRPVQWNRNTARVITTLNQYDMIDSNYSLDFAHSHATITLMQNVGARDDYMLQMLVLERRDDSCNLARYYVLSLEPTMFGDVALVREWGRIGYPGRRRLDLHADHRAAGEALEAWLARKVGRGYHVAGEKLKACIGTLA
jgi:predicted DNA-binding WGR domain protein/transcriptional regulator with XRE-family HTH domain